MVQKMSYQGLFLLAEALVISLIAIIQGQPWMLPIAGMLVTLAAPFWEKSRSYLALGGVGLSCVWLLWWRHYQPQLQGLNAIYTFASMLGGVGLSFLSILGSLDSEERGKKTSHPKISRAAIILHFSAAAIFFAGFRGYASTPIVTSWLSAFTSAIFAAIVLWGSLIRSYAPRNPCCTSDFHAKHDGGQRDAAEETISLAEMWMWPLIRPWLIPLACFVSLLFWLSTAVHIITPGNHGVRTYVGRMDKLPLDPGLHTSLPWPFGAITPVATAKPREVILGFRADPGKPILWERAHYIEEDMSLVGGGDDFLSISVPIFYHIGQPVNYLRSSTDPDMLLRELAQRVLLQLTVHRSAAEIMTTSRESLRIEMRNELQQELDRYQSGLHVDDIYFRDIHPPVTVASSYQEVVSALEEKEATIHESEQYRLDHLPSAKGDARQTVLKAEGAAESRKLQARGQAERFIQEANARSKTPSLYELREGFRIFDSALIGAKKIITDDSFSGQATLHIDLRRVLNRKLVDQTTPQVEPLVPNPNEHRETFDLNVEGYH